MTPKEFVTRWSQIKLKETAAAQSHFNDICALVGHPLPIVADPKGEFFTFEAKSKKASGGRGRADVWYKGRFIWEYKAAQADLDKAYQQLLLYRESLENPPLLITSDLVRILIHTNFTGTVKQIHEITLDRLLNGDGLDLLRRAFFEPQTFQPAQTQEKATQATAETFVQVVKTLQDWRQSHGDPAPPERIAHFVIRLFFCLFAEDLDLLPNKLFTQLIQRQGSHYYRFVESLRALFAAMRDGGPFGTEHIPYFDGGLFDDAFVPELPSDIIDHLLKAARQDWSAIDPSIFGTLFERVIDESKRAQLGAHYTSKDDILLIVEPVLMQPLREQWRELRNWVRQQRTSLSISPHLDVSRRLREFADHLATIRVLDPACGSGNFLYVALRLLLDLQKEVITFAAANSLDRIPLTVSPAQLYGIEINPYAHELAQITVWIGYLQWRKENGFSDFAEPILRPLHNIEHKDAILAYDAQGHPIEPTWPEADVIIGNPPFLGNKRMRTELGDVYVEDLRHLYGELSGQSDLVIYWFERARVWITKGKNKRAGLISTQSIRMGGNRLVLDRIKESGGIFMAWSDKSWVLDGASVRVSIVGFDDGTEKTRFVDGQSVGDINSDLSSLIDLTQAKILTENNSLSFQGVITVGPFEINEFEAKRLLTFSNSDSNYHNSDVVKPWINASDITGRPSNRWVINFEERSVEESSKYEKPFQYVFENVKPTRTDKCDSRQKEYWWLFTRSRLALGEAVKSQKRYIATPRVAKHRLFVFLNSQTVPDSRLFIFAREDDYFFGVLHSKMHEVWALATSSRHGIGNDPTYNNTTCFETYPFPWPPGQEPSEADDPRVLAIAAAARQLDQFRTAWLNPPATQDKTINIAEEKRLSNLTLTNLYNALSLYRDQFKGKLRDRVRWAKETKNIITLEQIDELDHIHTSLDHAVLSAYGWPPTLTDEQILERLLALNLARATHES